MDARQFRQLSVFIGGDIVSQGDKGAYVSPFRAYFQSTTPDSAPYLSMLFFGSYNPGGEASEPDAIAPVIRTVDCDGTERYFDFSGRQFNGKPQNGVYIYNGKKYVIK